MAKTSIKYKPLYDLLLVKEALLNKDKLSKEQLAYYTKLSKVDTVCLTGGRFSGKSYEVGEVVTEATLQNDFKTLYTRFTNVSMSDSVIPEIKEKIENNDLQKYFEWSNNQCKSLCGSGLISFKGMKAGSSGQTANLKSLKGFNCLVVEEAEEIPDFRTFEKVFYSIRSVDKQNISILLLNPTTTDHWIYNKLFNEKEVKEGYNGVVDNVLYVHTSYLDVDPTVMPANILANYERMKIKHPEDYNHIVMGGWIRDLEGAVFKKSQLNFFSLENFNLQNTETTIAFIDVADRGTDSLSMPIAKIIGNDVYIVDWYFSTDRQEITVPEIGYLAQIRGIEHIAVETNGLGAMYLEKLEETLGCFTYPFSQQANKHSRIILNSGFVRMNFHFRNDYESGSMYDKAMRELYAYDKDDKLNKKNTNYNDDAPDSVIGLWLTINDLIEDRW